MNDEEVKAIIREITKGGEIETINDKYTDEMKDASSNLGYDEKTEFFTVEMIGDIIIQDDTINTSLKKPTIMKYLESGNILFWHKNIIVVIKRLPMKTFVFSSKDGEDRRFIKERTSKRALVKLIKEYKKTHEYLTNPDNWSEAIE